ncbi:MAG: Lactoylglutathione lyase, partial [uncultured Thermoleophilia bacterium]
AGPQAVPRPPEPAGQRRRAFAGLLRGGSGAARDRPAVRAGARDGRLRDAGERRLLPGGGRRSVERARRLRRVRSSLGRRVPRGRPGRGRHGQRRARTTPAVPRRLLRRVRARPRRQQRRGGLPHAAAGAL